MGYKQGWQGTIFAEADAYVEIDLDGYAAKQWVADGYQPLGPYITYTDIDGYELTSAVDAKLGLKADKTTLDAYQIVGPYLTYTDIDGYELTSVVDGKLDLKADLTLLDSYQETGPYLVYSDIDGYLTKAEATKYLTYDEIDGYATKQFVEDGYATLTAFNDHNARHESGGADAIKLDDLAATDDNTDLNASSSAHGLLPKLSNVSTEFLNGQGSWATPAGGAGGPDAYAHVYFNYTSGGETTNVTNAGQDYKLNMNTRAREGATKNISVATDGTVTFSEPGLYSWRVMLMCQAPTVNAWYVKLKRRNGTEADGVMYLLNGVTTDGCQFFEWTAEMTAGQDGYLTVRRGSDTTFVLYNLSYGIAKIADI